MTISNDIKDREYDKFVEDASGKTAVRTQITVQDIEIGKVELKDSTTDTTAVVKSDGINNALVVTQNSVPTTTVTATDLDIRDLSRTTDSIQSEIIGYDVSTATYKIVHIVDTGTYNSLFTTPIDPSGVPITILDSGEDGLANNHNQQVCASFEYYYNGTRWDRVRGDLTDGLLVNLGTNNDVTITSGSVTATISGFVTDTDDNSIAVSQTLPLDIVENYIYSKTAGAWVRQEGTDDGLMFVRVIGLYTPNGDSILDDTTDTMKVSATNLDIRDLTSVSDSVEVKQSTASNLKGQMQILDSSGNIIDSHLSMDGDYHLGVTVEQNAYFDSTNSSTTNLAAGNSYTFTGTSKSTLGVNSIQVSLKTDQDATVYIDQSPNGTNWDIVDSYKFNKTLGNFGVTVQAVNSYYRVRVILTGTTDTTYFRLQSVLCPMADPLPRSLNSDGRLNVTANAMDLETGIQAKVTPFGKQKVVQPIRIIGSAFSGTSKDTRFWTETVTGSGSVTQSGEITLSTGATADSTAKYTTVRYARHVAGTANEFKFTGRLITAAEADNVRRCGVYDANDGFFFQVNGTTFGVGSRKGGADTIVNSGSFNGNYGTSLSMGTGMGNFVIWYWERTVYFFVNGTLLHTLTASTASWTNTLTLPITMENNNSGGNDTDNSFEVLVASVVRLGDLVTNPQSYYHASGQTAGVQLKIGAGAVHSVIFGGAANNAVVTLSDSTTAATPALWVYEATGALAAPVSVDMKGMPFSTGLRLVVTTGNASCTVVYE